MTPAEILAEDTFYNLDSKGERKKERYNPDTGYWTFDGCQRPLSGMWGDTETDDLTKPTSPPSSRRKAKKWNDDLGEYEVQKTKGYYIKVRCTDGIRSVFRVLTKKQEEAGQYNRDYGAVENSMVEDNLVKPSKLILQVPYYKGVETDSYPAEGYYFYRVLRCCDPAEDPECEDTPECVDVDDIDYGKEHFFVDCAQGNYYYSKDTYFWKTRKIISSVPYNLHGQIEHNISLGCISSPPYSYGIAFCHDLDPISTTISGAGVSFSYATNGDDNDKIEADTLYPRTFTPVDITKEFAPLIESELNEQEHTISMNISAGNHRIGWEREFTYCFNLGTTPEDENA